MGRKKYPAIATDADIDAALRRAKELERQGRWAISAHYDRAADRIVIELAEPGSPARPPLPCRGGGGVQFSIPRKYLQGLEAASPRELSEIELWGSGTGLHWPRLDVDHYVPGLLNNIFGTRKWMSHLGRLGGSSTSKAKAAAARANGRKGGRPRKTRAFASRDPKL